MSGKRDSNPRPPAWKASALSTELFPHDFLEIECKDNETRSHTDGFRKNNVKCLKAKGICRFVPNSSAYGF